MCRRSAALIAALSAGLLCQAQLVVDESLTPAQLVQNVLLGGGVTVSNITYNGVASPSTAQLGSGAFTQTGSLGLDAGVILSSGYAATLAGPGSDFSGDDTGTGTDDADLEALVGTDITNYAILEFDFVPTGDSLKFRYIFGSEEYPAFVCTFNDAFGFFLSGPGIAGPFSGGAVNIAVLPDGVTPVTINNVNNGLNNDPNDPNCPAVNPQYYVDNEMGTEVAFNGLTTVLTAFALVQCGETYHIKLAVADAGNGGGDTTYDTGVFLEGGSFTSTGQVVPELATGPGVVGNTMTEGCAPVQLVFTRQGDLSAAESVDMIITGTATPGVDYSPALPNTLEFGVGDSTETFVLTVPLDADGLEDIVITITQLITCANTNVETVFSFSIDSPIPLASGAVDISGACGESYLLEPLITGGMGFYQFQWSTGASTPTIIVSPVVTTTYTYTVQDTCSVAPLTGSITVSLPDYPTLEITVSPATQVPCLGTDAIAVLDAIGGNGVYTYEWMQASGPAGNTASITVPSGLPLWYYVTVTEGCGSAVQDSVLVSMTPLPPIAIDVTADTTVVCAGDRVELVILNVTGGNGVYTRMWTASDGSAIGTGNSIEVGVPVSGTYTITMEDQCGTIGSSQVSTLTPIYDPFQIRTTPDHVICTGDSSVLFVEVEGGSGYFFVDWEGREFTDPVYSVFPEESTSYTVHVADRCGEVLSKNIQVDVEDIQMGITVTNRGQDDWYLQAATVPIGLIHVWDMGDGAFYRRDEVVHSYVDVEDHWATLRMTTANGCTAVDSVLLLAPAHLYFPNAFSPDGDGVNDTFGPLGHMIDDFEMTIFDRLGQAIYTTTNAGTPWLGDINGREIGSVGVYVYKYRATGNYFPSVEGYGFVTLVK